VGDVRGTGTTAHIISPDITALDEVSHSVLHVACDPGLAQPFHHHLGGEDAGQRVHLVLARVLRRRPVRRFEDGIGIAEVAAVSEPHPTHQLRTQVRQNIAEQVRCHDDIIVARILQQPHAHGIDVGGVELDRGVTRSHLLGVLQEDAARGPQYVGLVDRRHLSPPVLHRILKGRLHDPAGRLARDAADGNGGISGEPLDGRLGVEALGDLGELDPDVHSLGILPEDHQVDVFAVVEWVAAPGPAGTQADIEVQNLPHANDGAPIRESLAPEFRREILFGFRCGFRSDGAEEGAMRASQKVEGARRQGIALLAPELPPDFTVEVYGFEAGGIQNYAGRIAHLLADAVPRQPGYSIFAHSSSLRASRGLTDERKTIVCPTGPCAAYFRFRYGMRPPDSNRATARGSSAAARIARSRVKLRIAPPIRSISSSSPLEHARLASGATTAGRPRLIAFRKKMRANDWAMTAPAPANFSAAAACSRLEPQPKFFAATMNSPGRRFARISG